MYLCMCVTYVVHYSPSPSRARAKSTGAIAIWQFLTRRPEWVTLTDSCCSSGVGEDVGWLQADPRIFWMIVRLFRRQSILRNSFLLDTSHTYSGWREWWRRCARSRIGLVFRATKIVRWHLICVDNNKFWQQISLTLGNGTLL